MLVLLLLRLCCHPHALEVLHCVSCMILSSETVPFSLSGYVGHVKIPSSAHSRTTDTTGGQSSCCPAEHRQHFSWTLKRVHGLPGLKESIIPAQPDTHILNAKSFTEIALIESCWAEDHQR